MLLFYLFALLLPIFSFAVVIRDDVPDAKYQEFAQNETFSPVGLVKAGNKNGTGFLIAPDIVMTAGHNVYQSETAQFSLDTSIGRAHYSGKVLLHPGFIFETNEEKKPTRMKDDIALILLDKPVPHIQPVTFYKGNSLIGKMMVSSGFGKTSTGLGGPLLRDQQKRAFTNEIDGQKRYMGEDLYYVSYFEKPQQKDIITELEGLGAKGDSGAPVFVEKEGKQEVMGILSLVSNESKYHDFNAILPISPYLPWIENHLSRSKKEI